MERLHLGVGEEIMQVTLNREEWPPKPIRQRVKGIWTREVGSHNPIAHIVGEPCIVLYGLSKKEMAFLKRKHCKVNDPDQREVLTILNHESIHCALFALFELTDDGLDNMVRDVGATRRLLEVN